MQMFLYAFTIFVSAFLLFQVQPIIAKIILPWFGGSAAVWTVCMVFFQIVLLLGYLYAHCSIRYLKPRTGVIVHVALLALSVLFLPVKPDPAWKPYGDTEPILRIIVLLAASVGLPYFLLSTTGPLVQAWFARTIMSTIPYRLYALSNLGSMLALLSYPTVVEPFVSSRFQLLCWSLAYGAFLTLCGASAVRSTPKLEKLAKAVAGDSAPGNEASRWSIQILWMGLAACASALMLAVTNHLCQDVAAIPFLWILPLTLYLLTFIICFDREGWYRREIFRWLLAAVLGGMVYGLYKMDSDIDLRVLIPLFAFGLFVCCMFCHGELARLKPHPRHLTAFYLMVSLGGVLGGLFVGFVAPHIFRGYFELPIGFAICAVLSLIVFRARSRTYAVWTVLSVAIIGASLYNIQTASDGYRVVCRNFYGLLKVDDSGKTGDKNAIRTLTHGTVVHGNQFLSPKDRRQPTTYYGPKSGVGLAIRLTRQSPQRVGVIGLGAGTLAAYGRKGDYYRFYEINPLVLELARTQFTFLNDCEAKTDVIMGDARLSLEREPEQQFDVLVVDAFSGDSIPVHLLTREAFALYFRHLKPEGVLAVHISNKHLDLEPVVRNLSVTFHKPAQLIDSDEDHNNKVFASTWVLLTDRDGFFKQSDFEKTSEPLKGRPGMRTWTDDYSNLFQLLN